MSDCLYTHCDKPACCEMTWATSSGRQGGLMCRDHAHETWDVISKSPSARDTTVIRDEEKYSTTSNGDLAR